jgi:hypothetical protein
MTHSHPQPQSQVYFVDGRGNANGPDPAILQAIQSNGGKKDVDTIGVWANNDDQRSSTGEWTFFQPCMQNGTFTTTVINSPAYQCNHSLTTNSPLGSQMSLAFSWQAHYGPAVLYIFGLVRAIASSRRRALY